MSFEVLDIIYFIIFNKCGFRSFSNFSSFYANHSMMSPITLDVSNFPVYIVSVNVYSSCVDFTLRIYYACLPGIADGVK